MRGGQLGDGFGQAKSKFFSIAFGEGQQFVDFVDRAKNLQLGRNFFFKIMIVKVFLF